jgi:hypothetical protein
MSGAEAVEAETNTAVLRGAFAASTQYVQLHLAELPAHDPAALSHDCQGREPSPRAASEAVAARPTWGM